jgi:hypothetical protein
MAQRDDCSKDPCVYSRYEERLSQIAAFVPDAGTPDLADAGTVAETRRIAAEWGIPMLRGRLYLPQQQIKDLKFSIGETPVMRA